MATPPLQYIDDAIDVVTTEIEILEAERRAFRSFVRRLDDIEPARRPTSTTGSIGDGAVRTVTVEEPTVDDRLQQARTAYRETVMTTPHYDREYDESLEENVSAELGTSLATRLCDGTTLTPAVHQLLRESGTTAITERTEFLTSLRTERRSLVACQNSLTDVQRSLDELYSRLDADPDTEALGRIDERLTSLGTECETVATRRQRQIHNRSGIILSGIDESSLAQYLYEDSETICPVLTAVAECVDTIQSCRTQCLS